MCSEWVEEIVASLSHNALFCTATCLTFYIILLLFEKGGEIARKEIRKYYDSIFFLE